MPSVYVDTSALGRVLLAEPDRETIARALAGFDLRISSRLLRLELRRLARRHGREEDALSLLSDVSLVPLDESILDAAETLSPAGVATLDAIHLATALRLGSDLDALMTYDGQLAAGAEHHGIRVIPQAG